MKNELPVYEREPFWVCRTSHGFEVYRVGATASVRVATIGDSYRNVHWDNREHRKPERLTVWEVNVDVAQ